MAMSSLKIEIKPKIHKNKTTLNSKNPLRIVVLNCQSLANKTAQLAEMTHRVKPDSIIGTESWLKPKHLNSKLNFFHLNLTFTVKTEFVKQVAVSLWLYIQNSLAQ